MNKLRESKPIWFALLWIAIYILTVNAGDALGETLGFRGLTAILLTVLLLVMIVYLRTSGGLDRYGVRVVAPKTLRLTLFYLPLFAITFLQYGKGFATSLDGWTVLFALVLVVAVGFIEEILFRGFLLHALRRRGNVTRAILISGVTFGIGHIVNLLRGYSPTDQAVQLVAAILIGIALAYCVVLTGSILPGVAFHVLFNLSGTLTAHSPLGDTITVGIIALVMIPYILFLRHRLASVGPAIPTTIGQNVRTP